ncbi:MAG: 16S rRNA (guanine(527)-N(7))-methyltransferase RsmG [Pseudomonadota bacterium]
MTASRPDRIAEGAKALGVALSDSQVAMLHRYLDLLEKWNAAYNLTAVRGRDAMEVEHILDSLAIVPHVQLRGGTVADVGTGAGLPGMVLAIALPENRYVLIDSNGKKTRFLMQAAHELGLRHVVVFNGRVEDYVPATQVDVVTSRAFASLADMVQGCRALLESGALALAMKGVRPDDEIAALPPDVAVKDVIALRVPGLDKERHLVCIVARRATAGAAG